MVILGRDEAVVNAGSKRVVCVICVCRNRHTRRVFANMLNSFSKLCKYTNEKLEGDFKNNRNIKMIF